MFNATIESAQINKCMPLEVHLCAKLLHINSLKNKLALLK